MRSIAATLFGISLAAGATYAQADLAHSPERVAGTLTCVTRPDLSLVFGRSPVADCTFESQTGGFRQDYQALLPEKGSAGEIERADRIVLRVWTHNDARSHARLDGAFRASSTGESRTAVRFAGDGTQLELVSHSSRTKTAFAHTHDRIDLAAR